MARITPILEQSNRCPIESSLGAVESIATDTTAATVGRWLDNLSVDPECLVTIQWNDFLTIQTTWAIFVEYWESFCYPSSDDVNIWAEDSNWLLQYHHWEVFEIKRQF